MIYPIPNKEDLINRLSQAIIFSKFDMKSGFWQIQIHEEDKHKTAFTTSFGHYEWNVMPFVLKNASSEIQTIMNGNFNPFTNWSIVCIHDIIYSKSIEEHFPQKRKKEKRKKEKRRTLETFKYIH